jgi:hypothetical protein
METYLKESFSMNDDLAWKFDAAVIEWLMVLIVLVILAIADAMITRQSFIKFK